VGDMDETVLKEDKVGVEFRRFFFYLILGKFAGRPFVNQLLA